VAAHDKRKYVDLTARAHALGRNGCLLYRNLKPKNTDSLAYLRVLKLVDGTTFWVVAWPRLVNNETIVEIRLSLKT
jgi:hypothetical protein